MVQRISALHGHVRPGRHGPTGEPGVRLSERRYEDIWQVTAWPERLAQAAQAVASAAGVAAAPGPGQAAFGGAMALRTEPLRWLIVSEEALDEPAIGRDDGTVLDLGHARTTIRVEGPAASELMARMAPLDFRPRSFADGRVATSAIHHVASTIVAHDGGFEVFVYRSFGLALWQHLVESAEQFGLEIALFPQPRT